MYTHTHTHKGSKRDFIAAENKRRREKCSTLSRYPILRKITPPERPHADVYTRSEDMCRLKFSNYPRRAAFLPVVYLDGLLLLALFANIFRRQILSQPGTRFPVDVVYVTSSFIVRKAPQKFVIRRN